MALSSLHRCAYLNINDSSQNTAQTFSTLLLRNGIKKLFISYSFSFVKCKTVLCTGYCNKIPLHKDKHNFSYFTLEPFSNMVMQY